VPGSFADTVFLRFAYYAYLRVQAGIIALNCKRYNEAIDQFTAAVNASKSFVKIEIHSKYEVFTEVRQ
jgi:hypothetical protein